MTDPGALPRQSEPAEPGEGWASPPYPCPLCEGEGNVIQGISIYSKSHAYPEIVTCPDCGGTGTSATPGEQEADSATP